ncbi:phage head closure protein [Paenibacillus cineris]|uniref:phage head closure protein n=1 Tax=Paenibacillus cineris TaxID=237530 RepID=UPI001B089126|nr:phage head closure protein [Paenibacillus cineris]GIO63576.1 hypothetical protein J43TS9_51500 [Paenibacillus cineris]
MTFDHEITLIGEGGFDEDDLGNQIPIDPTETTVFCGLRSVGRTEFYNAAVTGLRPELVFVIHGYEYSNEKKVTFEGEDYRVIRTYKNNFEQMELTCEKVAADG